MIIALIVFAIITIGFGGYCCWEGAGALKYYLTDERENKYLYLSIFAIILGFLIIVFSILFMTV